MNFGTGIGDLMSAVSSAMSGFGGAVVVVLGIVIGGFALEHLQSLLLVRQMTNKYSSHFKADQLGQFKEVLRGNLREARRRGWSTQRWKRSTDRYWSRKLEKSSSGSGGSAKKKSSYDYAEWSQRWFGAPKRRRYYSRAL